MLNLTWSDLAGNRALLWRSGTGKPKDWEPLLRVQVLVVLLQNKGCSYCLGSSTALSYKLESQGAGKEEICFTGEK